MTAPAVRKCRIEGCEGTYRCKGLCRTHSERNSKYGDPLAGPPFRRPASQRTCEVDGCDRPAPKRRICGKHNNAQWRAANPDRARAAWRRNRRDFYANNVGRVAEENRRYRIANPAKFQGYQIARSEAILSHPDYCPFPYSEWDAMKKRHDYRCAYCGDRPKSLEMDHVVPVSRGGRHAIANILPACVPCNRSKHNHFLSEWKLTLFKRVESASAA